jgi:uncharacterized RDD family membrane protein YckC
MENHLLDTEFEEPKRHLQYAGFWERFGAALIDSIILGIPGVALMYLFGYSIESIIASAKEEDMESFRSMRYFAVVVISAVMGWLYHAFQESGVHQATLGKRVLNLKVTDLDGQRITFEQASLRYWFKHLVSSSSNYTRFMGIPEISAILSILVLANYLIQPFTEKKQALHDIVARTLVYKDLGEIN